MGEVMGVARFTISCQEIDNKICFFVPKGRRLGRAVLFSCVRGWKQTYPDRTRDQMRRIWRDMLAVGSAIGTSPEWPDKLAVERETRDTAKPLIAEAVMERA